MNTMEFLSGSFVDLNSPALENAAHPNPRHQSKTKTKTLFLRFHRSVMAKLGASRRFS